MSGFFTIFYLYGTKNLVISRFFSIYCTITTVKNIVSYGGLRYMEARQIEFPFCGRCSEARHLKFFPIVLRIGVDNKLASGKMKEFLLRIL